MISIFLCLGLGLVFTLVAGFVAFDQLVRVQHEDHYQDWLADHKPDGLFWRQPGHSLLHRMNWSGSLCLLAWLFSTPDWVKQDEVAGRHLRRFRFCILVWNIGFLLLWLWSLGHPELFPSHQHKGPDFALHLMLLPDLA